MLLLWATVTARQNESDISQIAENSKSPIGSPGKSQSQVKNHMVQMTQDSCHNASEVRIWRRGC